MNASDVDLLASVMDTTEGIIRGVRPDQAHEPTPCAELDVARLVDHLDGWAISFAGRLTGASVEGDPNDYRAGADPVGDFHHAAATIVDAYRKGGEAAQQLPIGVLLMEFLTHGWDLATATGQPAEFSATEADTALAAGRQMLKPEYRGPGKTFGYETEVADSAPPVAKLVAFLGRSTEWQSPTAG